MLLWEATFLSQCAKLTHCQPILMTHRVVPWGMPMSPNEIPYLKGIGIRIHTVRYQKLRKRALDNELDGEIDDENDVSAKERRRILGKHQRQIVLIFVLFLPAY